MRAEGHRVGKAPEPASQAVDRVEREFGSAKDIRPPWRTWWRLARCRLIYDAIGSMSQAT